MLANSGNFPPSKQVLDVYNDLASQIDVAVEKIGCRLKTKTFQHSMN